MLYLLGVTSTRLSVAVLYSPDHNAHILACAALSAVVNLIRQATPEMFNMLLAQHVPSAVCDFLIPAGRGVADFTANDAAHGSDETELGVYAVRAIAALLHTEGAKWQVCDMHASKIIIVTSNVFFFFMFTLFVRCLTCVCYDFGFSRQFHRFHWNVCFEMMRQT